MKKIIKIIFILIFSFIVIGATPKNKNDDIYSLETKIFKECDFVQNGVRVEYYVDSSKDKEFSRLVEAFTMNYGKNFKINKNEIIYKDSNTEVDAIIWEEGIKLKVQISYQNNSKGKSSEEVKEELKKIQNIKSTHIRYFTFFKGRINLDNKNYTQDLIKQNINKNSLKVLEVHNGYVANAILKDGQRVNIGFMKYNTGEYLIVGTPMIFVTY